MGFRGDVDSPDGGKRQSAKDSHLIKVRLGNIEVETQSPVPLHKKTTAGLRNMGMKRDYSA